MLVGFARYSRDRSFVVLSESHTFVLVMAAGAASATSGSHRFKRRGSRFDTCAVVKKPYCSLSLRLLASIVSPSGGHSGMNKRTLAVAVAVMVGWLVALPLLLEVAQTCNGPSCVGN